MLPEVELVNHLLDLKKPSFTNSHELMLYERGYLTGLLARLAHDDSDVKRFLEHEIKRAYKRKPQ